MRNLAKSNSLIRAIPRGSKATGAMAAMAATRRRRAWSDAGLRLAQPRKHRGVALPRQPGFQIHLSRFAQCLPRGQRAKSEPDRNCARVAAAVPASRLALTRNPHRQIRPHVNLLFVAEFRAGLAEFCVVTDNIADGVEHRTHRQWVSGPFRIEITGQLGLGCTNAPFGHVEHIDELHRMRA